MAKLYCFRNKSDALKTIEKYRDDPDVHHINKFRSGECYCIEVVFIDDVAEQHHFGDYEVYDLVNECR